MLILVTTVTSPKAKALEDYRSSSVRGASYHLSPQSEVVPLPRRYVEKVSGLDSSLAQTNGSGGAARALHRHAFGDNFRT